MALSDPQHPSSWTFWRAVLFWRIGVANAVLFALVLATIIGGWAYVGEQQRATCERQNDGGKVLRDLVTAVQIAQRQAGLHLPGGFQPTPEELRAQRLTDQALSVARRELKPRRC